MAISFLKGMRISIGICSSRQYSSVLLFPRSERLMTNPQGISSILTAPTASFKSCSPNGVGSVTSRTKSAFFMDSITGHEVPGGASTIVSLSRPVLDKTFLLLDPLSVLIRDLFQTFWLHWDQLCLHPILQHINLHLQD